MNDREKFEALTTRLALEASRVAERLMGLVAKNQNQPPLGDADGSFTTDEWYAARDIARSVDDVVKDFRRLKKGRSSGAS